MQKGKNTILDMFVTIHEIYEQLESDRDIELYLEPLRHALQLVDGPANTMLFFQMGKVHREVVIQRYNFLEGDESHVETRKFSLDDLADIEKYIKEVFVL